MALTITHAQVAGTGVDADAIVDGADWDANHTITGSVAASEVTSGAALTKTDDTNVTLTLGGAPTTALLTATSVTVGWAGTLAETRGGTGQSTFTQGDLLYASSANTLAKLAKDTNATRYLSNTGASNNPAWAQVNVANGVTGTLPVANGGTGVAAITAHYLLIGNGTSAATLLAPGTSGLPLVSNGASLDPSYSTLPVSGGGSGANSQTAYAVLCGGTTSTSAYQSIASVGTSGQVLTSNGAAALPTFQTVAGVPVTPQGRLTLTSGTSVTTSDVTGATSVYFTPTGGNYVPIYNGSATINQTFAELTLALDSNSGHTNYQQSGKNYDLFVINDSGTIRLGTGPKWNDGAGAGSDTARGTGAASTELELKNGFLTNKNTITIRFGSASGNTVSVSANQATYVGTLRTTADGQTEDSKVKRFLYNAYNQSKRQLLRNDSTASWNYSTASFRQANASSSNQVEYLAGLTGSAIDVQVMGIVVNSTSTYRVIYVGVGIDSTTVNSATVQEFSRANDTQVAGVPKSYYTGFAQLGYHYVAWLEKGAGSDTQTWIGTEATNLYYAGIFGGIFQ